MILRERDNTNGWRGSADGTLEERRFYGQNWRADVALVMKTTGRPLERIKYSAYGVATLKPGYDYNGDGVIDADDLGDIITDAASPTPPASADWNLDGTPNTTDSSEYSSDYYALTSTSWGYGDLTLADTGNRKGYAGYEHDPLTDQYHVRHRVYEPQLGRWTRRDPLGYVDGVSVYEYVGSHGIVYLDSSGRRLVVPHDDDCNGHECGSLKAQRWLLYQDFQFLRGPTTCGPFPFPNGLPPGYIDPADNDSPPEDLPIATYPCEDPCTCLDIWPQVVSSRVYGWTGTSNVGECFYRVTIVAHSVTTAWLGVCRGTIVACEPGSEWWPECL